MLIQAKEVAIWRTEVDDRPGEMARVLESLAAFDLELVLGNQGKIVDVSPISGKEAEEAALRAGFKPLDRPMVLVRGEDRPGVCHQVTRALGDAGISMDSLIGQAMGGFFQILIGLRSRQEAARAVEAIKKAV
jgi:hypothetical protein